MYKRYVILTFSFVLFVFSFVRSYGQDTTGFVGFKTPKMPYAQHILKSNIIPVLAGQMLVCGEIRLTYEHPVTHNQSVLAGVAYNFPNLVLLQLYPHFFHDYSIRGARGILGYRIYPLKDAKAPKGFFFGPYFSYNFAKIAEKHGGSYEVLNYFNASMTTGYQVIHKHFVFEVFGGLGYKNNFILNYDDHIHQQYSSAIPDVLSIFGKNFKYVKVLLQVNFGYSF